MGKRHQGTDWEEFGFQHQGGWRPPSQKPLTANHRRYVEAIYKNEVIFCHGMAGTGKTILALQAGLRLIKHGHFDKYLYVRQDIVRPLERDTGALPGELGEKLNPLLAPVLDNLDKLAPPGEIDYTLKKKIEVTNVGGLRGRSPGSAIIHIDEAQNVDWDGLYVALTRLNDNEGSETKIILTGDFISQKDFDSHPFTGFETLSQVFKGAGYPVVTLSENDLLRSEKIAAIDELFRKAKAIANQP